MKELFKNFTKLFTKKNLLTIPNAMMLFRIVLIPLFIVLYLKEHYIIALIVLAVSWASDIADGYVARHFNQISELGKLSTGSVYIATIYKNISFKAFKSPLENYISKPIIEKAQKSETLNNGK